MKSSKKHLFFQKPLFRQQNYAGALQNIVQSTIDGINSKQSGHPTNSQIQKTTIAPSNTSKSNDDNVPTWVWIVIALVVILIVAAICCCVCISSVCGSCGSMFGGSGGSSGDNYGMNNMGSTNRGFSRKIKLCNLQDVF